jgi:hypothetical protein
LPSRRSARPRPLLPALLLALAVAVPLAGDPKGTEPPPPLAGWSLENETFARPLAESRVRVVNDFGNVYVRTGDQQVEISTVAQRQDGDPYRLLLEARAEEGVLVIEVKPALEAGKSDPGGAALGAFRRRLDLTLFQPAGVPLAVVAEDSIQTKKLRSDVDLLARKGTIFLDTFGHVRAKAFDKQIRGVLRDTRWSRPAEIETRTGEIKLYFLQDADVAIEATTMGAVTTDFSLEIERAPGQIRKTARARLGKGSARLSLRSESGPIQLLLNV